MKGKGKKEKDANDSDDCPLQFLDFYQIDHARHCPRFTNVLQRNEDEGIGFEDLDVLQLELETLLVSVVKRKGQLESEMEALLNWHDFKHRDRKSPIKAQPESVGKRSKANDERPSKRFKECAASTSSKVHNSRPTKAKNLPLKYTELEFVETHPEFISKKLPFKNDIPDQFFQFLEPYCCEIAQDHVKMLSEAVKAYEEDTEYFKIPNLGKHYTLKWEQEDLLDDRKGSSKKNSNSSNKKKGLSPLNSSSGSSTQSGGKSPKKGQKESEASFGALTQRLVCCLIEEKLLSANNDSKNNDNNSGKGNNVGGNGNIFKSLNLGNTTQLERRIRKELEEQGILSMEDILNGNDSLSNEEDEILEELKRCQAELKDVSSKNQSHLKRLHSLAKKEIAKQEIVKKLQNSDQEVIECYRKFLLAKQKKRSPTKKEKEQAFKALKERDNIFKSLSSL